MAVNPANRQSAICCAENGLIERHQLHAANVCAASEGMGAAIEEWVFARLHG